MKSKIDNFRMIFHTLAIGCNHINSKKLSEIGELYRHHVSFSSLVNHVSRKHFFHVFLISQQVPNYINIVSTIKLEFPNSIFVVLVEEPSSIQELIDSKELFFIINQEYIEYSYHQLWQWLLMIGTKKFSFNNDNNIISIAGGVLSLIDESYQKVDKIYKLTRKQMAILKILLEFRGEPVSREVLIERIWVSEQKLVTDRVIDTNIVAIRKMIGDKGRTPKYIQTIFGQGYKLNLE